MIAYHYVQDNNSMLWADDDGETGAGETLLNVIHSNKLSNVIILVCRWYGGRHMYARCWQLIMECAAEALQLKDPPEKLVNLTLYPFVLKNPFFQSKYSTYCTPNKEIKSMHVRRKE